MNTSRRKKVCTSAGRPQEDPEKELFIFTKLSFFSRYHSAAFLIMEMEMESLIHKVHFVELDHIWWDVSQG